MSAFNLPFADNPPDGTMRSSRLARGLSLRSVARTMGVSAAYLSDIERGRRNLTPDIKRLFLAAIGGKQESQEDKSRADFEAWLSAALDAEPDCGSEYASADIQWAWAAWQAARADAGKPEPVELSPEDEEAKFRRWLKDNPVLTWQVDEARALWKSIRSAQ